MAPIVVIFVAWLVCQLLKVLSSGDVKSIFDVGGMPSSHSALVGSLAAVVTLVQGWFSISAAICYVLVALVVHDAVKVRKHHTLREALSGLFVGIFVAVILSVF